LWHVDPARSTNRVVPLAPHRTKTPVANASRRALPDVRMESRRTVTMATVAERLHSSQPTAPPPRESTPESRARWSEACRAPHFSEVELLPLALGHETHAQSARLRCGQEHRAAREAHAGADRTRMNFVHDHVELAGAGESSLGQIAAVAADTCTGLRHGISSLSASRPDRRPGVAETGESAARDRRVRLAARRVSSIDRQHQLASSDLPRSLFQSRRRKS